MSLTEAQKRATVKHRQSKRRVELLMAHDSPESRALDRLTEIYGSQAEALRQALSHGLQYERTQEQ